MTRSIIPLNVTMDNLLLGSVFFLTMVEKKHRLKTDSWVETAKLETASEEAEDYPNLIHTDSICDWQTVEEEIE